MRILELKDQIMFYDIEVFKYGWSVVFKNQGRKKTFVCKDDSGITNLALRKFLLDHPLVLCGFNSKHYDDHVLHAMTEGRSRAEIKELNDWIIEHEQQGWTWPGFQAKQDRIFHSFDLRDDMPINVSLKSAAGNMGKPIVESSVPFDLDRELTDDEWIEVIKYNENDVDETEMVFDNRLSYLNTKIELGEKANLSWYKSLSMTNAKLTSAYLVGPTAKPKEWDDALDYKIPDEVMVENKEHRGFFENIKETHGNKLSTKVADVPHVLAWGGLHGARNKFHMKAKDGWVILNADGTQYYPSMMVEYGFLSRAVTNPDLFYRSVSDRLRYKDMGEKAKQEPLKLVNNTTYGASNNQYNALYDPLMANSICATGQLLLIDLAEKVTKIDTADLIQSNTDGIMIMYHESKEDEVMAVFDEWQKRARIRLEYDRIKSVHQKDVNNYLIEMENGKVKVKGAFLNTYGGRSLVNGSMVAVSKAIAQFFIDGTAPMDTLKKCTDVLDFQIIAKSGGGYKETYWDNNGVMIPVNKVNRVYASKNKKHGRVYKVKPGGSPQKIASLPDHCVIDNEAKLTLDNIDLSWYNEIAIKRIAQFIGKDRGGLNMSVLPSIAERKSYIRYKGVVQVFEKGDVIPKGWDQGELVSKKVYDEWLKSGSSTQTVEEEAEEIAQKVIDIMEEKEMSQTTETAVAPVVAPVVNAKAQLARKIYDLRTFLAGLDWTKDGINQHQEYKYISADQYRENFEKGLRAVGLDYAFSVVDYVFNQKGASEKMHLTNIKFECEIIDIETGESRLYRGVGDGADNGDKGVYKAQTGALKYFIANNFMVKEGGDPEASEQARTTIKKASHVPVSQEKREAIVEKMMSTDEVVTPENLAILKDMRKQVIALGLATTDMQNIPALVKSGEMTNNRAIELIMQMEEIIEENE